jgi:microcystin-dependent protein
MKFLFGIFLLSLGIGIGPLMAQNQKASDKASEMGMIIPSGTIMPYAGATAPAGWVFAAGQEYNTTGTYAKLFAAIGSAYCTNDHGAGGSCTTGVFRLPDLRGRFVGGRDNMNGIAANRITAAKTLDGTILGKAGGSQNVAGHYHGHTLNITSSGSGTVTGTVGGADGTHNHTITDPGHAHNQLATYAGTGGGGFAGISGGGNTNTQITSSLTSISINSTNSGHGHGFSLTAPNHAHANGNFAGTVGLASGSGGCDGNSDSCNNLSPTIILNYIIKL